jgi:hypothetical protein
MVTLVCQMVTGAFNASRYELTIIICVPLSLVNLHIEQYLFLVWVFEFYLALLFYVEYIFDIPDWFKVYKEHSEG